MNRAIDNIPTERLRTDLLKIRKEMSIVNKYITEHPNANKFSSSRAKLRALLNQLAVGELEIRQTIIKRDDETRLLKIIEEIGGEDHERAEKFLAELKRLRFVEPGAAVPLQNAS